MAEELRMPSSSGGLMRYSDEYKSRFQIKPSYIVLLIALVVISEIILKMIAK